MPSWIVKLGALVALAHTVAGSQISLRTTTPPANEYVTHCTVILDDEFFGCKGSSKPFGKKCGHNRGIQTKSICDTSSVTVDWSTAQVTFQDNNGHSANCTLSSTEEGGHCNTDDPDEFPIEHNGAERLGAGAALWGLGTMAATLFI
ncbi:uncharacterized protein BO87DRAFT_372405 [Aspergillus neoniger CBS 115656]|uniref:Uncharacterized protein n=1 Tax=Aspergillus neoniger (strain CBS 115656) TaxID=1448310 RepID=A0A318YZ03_ASPNB|nr:hypothetical protein BO87DRAFT_372405 [Aspergillus neoniger CBS 115656]PYH39237.1 hypothetical protein BO87DRAFT_372405 [Aspergillus neoniger CBS 115656]